MITEYRVLFQLPVKPFHPAYHDGGSLPYHLVTEEIFTDLGKALNLYNNLVELVPQAHITLIQHEYIRHALENHTPKEKDSQ